MTLKTTQEQTAELLVKALRFVALTRSEVANLCHDANKARELEKQVARLDAGWTEAIEVSNAFYAQTCKLQKEIADLRAKLVEKDSSIGHQAMTTLKTTKEQHDSWRHYSAEKLRLMLGKEDIDNLCHDADRARELGEENADLHAKLDRYTRIAESGKSYGDDLDNIERIAELEAKLDEALTALAPFAHPDLCEQLGGNVEGDESIIFKRNKAPITLGDCRKAAAIRALKE